MREDLEQRAQRLAVYILENRATIRMAAKRFGVSKSTVHKDLSSRLAEYDRALYLQVREILEINKAERHIRGGDATRRKYKKNTRPDLPARA
jgi:putative DeoR family transcriptional regulator (stage III sporulation protein D)